MAAASALSDCGRRWRFPRGRTSAGRWIVSDTLTGGRRFRALAIVDDYTRECLALLADTSLSGACVARELDAIIAVRGKPTTCVSDNGTELTSMAILVWSKRTGIDLSTADAARAARMIAELL